MERKFYNEELEQLVKEKADQYKMYPSERVWKGIYKSLHSFRRWYWFSFILFLAGVSYYAIYEVNSSPAKTAVAQANPISSDNNKNNKPAIVVPFITLPVPAATIHPKKQQSLIVNMFDNSGEKNTVSDLSPDNYNKDRENHSIASRNALPVNQFEQVITNLNIPESVSDDISLDFPAALEGQIITNRASKTLSVISDENKDADNKRINWLQENAVYELRVPKLRRLSWQLSFSPTMNYRKLMGNKNARTPSDVKNIPIALNIQGDLDHLVNHKPALGFELGSHLLYAVSKNLTLKAGIQFNYSRYEIQAYSSASSERATIALNDFSGFDNDSITSYTSLRNFGGNEVKDLNNQYFQLSVPFGAEFVIIGNKKIQFAVAGTIQPTYLLNRNTYLITTDYKNYTREPSLVRRWNINTSAEAFVSYNAVGVKWQIGPQFRYQLLSSYSNKYPIKEYLMEYGIKVGVSKTIR